MKPESLAKANQLAIENDASVLKAEAVVSDFGRIFEVPHEDVSSIAVLYQQLSFWKWLEQSMKAQLASVKRPSKKERQRLAYVTAQKNSTERLLEKMNRSAARPLPEWVMDQMVAWVDEGVNGVAGTAVGGRMS